MLFHQNLKSWSRWTFSADSNGLWLNGDGLANRLTRPASEHGLAGWLETDFLCDRQGRRFVPNWHQHNRVRVHFQQLEAWYRTLDQLVAAKEKIEVALYHHLRDLFSFKPDLVLYDITSTYFEGAGPADFAKHGWH